MAVVAKQASYKITLPAPKTIYQVYYRGAWNKGSAKVRVCVMATQQQNALTADVVCGSLL